MTDREIMLQRETLKLLENQGRPRTEVFIHAQVQAVLGVPFTAAEINATLVRAQGRGFVTGLPNAADQIEWRITSEGRHHLIQ